MDGSGSDDTTNRGGETKLKLLATEGDRFLQKKEGDREVALPRKGHLKFTFRMRYFPSVQSSEFRLENPLSISLSGALI